jgi:hypothetical protein
MRGCTPLPPVSFFRYLDLPDKRIWNFSVLQTFSSLKIEYNWTLSR